MKHVKLLFILLIAASSGIAYAQSENQQELIEIANKLRNDVNNELLSTLEPSLDDLQRIFQTREAVGNVWMYAADVYSSMPDHAVQASAEQTEVIVMSVIGSDLKVHAEHDLPGGYNTISNEFKDDITIYAIKYVVPGETSGYALNAFYKVNDHWVFIPKVWRAFE